MKKFLLVKSLFVCLCLVILSSCREKKDTIVEVHVLNNSGQRVVNAHVKLLTSSPYELNSIPVLEMEATSNSSGVAMFNFNDVYQLGQAGVAVLEIEVSKGNEEGKGIVKVEQEITTKETVIILP